jgi:long-chain acyl-CoA synthetase
MMGSVAAEQETYTRVSQGRGTPLFPDEPHTLGDLFYRAAEKFDKPDALNHKTDGEWRRIPSSEMLRRAEHIAAGLHSLGLGKGDRAAILAANSPAWTLADAGCQIAGIVDVPIYTTLGGPSVCYILNDSGTRVLFLENKAAFDRIADVFPACATVEKLVFLDAAGVEEENAISIGELERMGEELREEDAGIFEGFRSASRMEDVATLIYTSGTTGEPKGVMLTHANIISNVIDAGEKYSLGPDDVPLSVLPLSHVFERSAMYLYVLNGMSVFYAESVDKVPENLGEVRPTIFIGVPRIFEKVYARAKLQAARAGGAREKIFEWAISVAREWALKQEARETVPLWLSLRHALADRLVYSKLRKFFGGRLRSCITGGAALSDDIYLIFTGAGITIKQGYGLTETSPVISSNNPFDTRLGTVGKPIRNVEVRIAADGEIEVRGPGVMLGYYNKPEATREAFTGDGWFRTGDIGEIDVDGFLTITDRKKELFKTSGGKYIAPTHIEGMIRSSRFVNQAVLVGNERKFPAALIVPNFDMLRSYAKHKGFEIDSPEEFCRSERIKDLMRRQIDALTKDLAQFEKVKKFVLLENEFTVDGGEMTPTLKIKRRVIDEKYRDVIDKMYSE